MFFVFGSYNKRIKKQAVADTCPTCSARDSMELAVGCKVYHLMFIPVAPGKTRVTQRCKACKTEFVTFDEHKEAAARMLAETRRPWYLYFLLLLVALIALYGTTMIVIASIQR
jgi:hypothetical protein